MKEIVPADSRYVPLAQQPSCCVPTCIQIVMLKRRIPLVSQELLGHYLGLVVSKENAVYFWNARTSNKAPPAGYGTQINKKEYDPNRAFAKLRIPLKMRYMLIDKFDSLGKFTDYLANVDKKDMDVIACFDYRELYGERKHTGHATVVDRIYRKKGAVRLVDPSRNGPKWRVVSIRKLYLSMKRHGPRKMGGFWELKS